MSHIRMSHVTHMNESCHTYEWVMSHIQMSHVTHTNEPCHTYNWVMSHIWMSHVTHTNEPCHTYAWVMPRISWDNTSQHKQNMATHETIHIYIWVISHKDTIVYLGILPPVFMPHTSQDTHGNTNHDNTKLGDSWDISNIDAMGWLRLVGSLTL